MRLSLQEQSVTNDIPDYALMAGVPVKQSGWMSRHGVRLPAPDAEGLMVCPKSDWRYRLNEVGKLKCLERDEDKTVECKS